MQWSDITVQQFQQLTELWQDGKADPVLLMFDMVEVCHRLTPNQVDSLSNQDFARLAAELAFLNVIPDWKPQRYVDVDGRRYRFVYDVRQIHAARNIEVKSFSQGGLIPNMHRMAASMVVPQKKHKLYRWQWVDDKYDAAKHEQYANDLLQAPITSIYGSAVFFCEVFMKSIPAIADYLTSSIMDPKMKMEAKQLLLDSCRISDGSTTLSQLESLKASALMQLGNFPISNS